MRNFIQKFIILFITLLFSALPSFSEEIKIEELNFDDADGIIYVKTKGEIGEDNIVKKGYLKEPDRVYLDFANSVLTTPKKRYSMKYSSLNDVKISQFSTEPNVVRIVLEYNSSFSLANFKVFKSKKGFFIKLKQKAINSPLYKTSYRNSKASERKIYYKGTKAELVQPTENILNEEIKPDIIKPISKIPSNFYIDSVLSTKDGILINGVGKINVIPSFTLANPERLIIDLDDTVVNPEIRNKSYKIGQDLTIKENLKIGQNSQSIARLVIDGENSKDYRWIISPDSRALYLTNKKNIITSTISDTNAMLTKTGYTNSNGSDILGFTFNESICFGAFEENSNLYIDISNLETFDDTILDPIKRAGFDFKTVRLALDKLRIVIPIQDKTYNIKTNPDNTEMRITVKPLPKETKKPKEGTVLVPISVSKKDKSEISNLFTVVIDAGHGGSDVGATRDCIYEKDITLKIAKMVESNLKKKKVKTYMIREKDIYVTLADRSNFSNEKKPDLFVSVHVNSSINEENFGVETHYWKDDSIKYANTVHKEFSKKIKSWKTKDRGIFKSQFYVINHTEAPAILCEVGFISNPDERKELIKQKRQQEIAEAITNGIYNYLKMRK